MRYKVIFNDAHTFCRDGIWLDKTINELLKAGARSEQIKIELCQ
jgi:hypothetical protein